MKNRLRQIKVRVPKQELDQEEFKVLYEVLYDALKSNRKACAQALGIDVRVWKKWQKEPPTWKWWNHILRQCVLHTVSSIQARPSSATRNHLDGIRTRLSSLHRPDKFYEELDNLASSLYGATDHLRRLLLVKGMFKDEIFKAANAGGYSHKSLERASIALGIVKTQEGYGKHKRSYWRLPNIYDADVEGDED